MTSERVLPNFSFQVHPGLEAFLVRPPEFMARQFSHDGSQTETDRPPSPIYLATSAIVFDRQPSSARAGTAASPPRVLLVQRASTDSMPSLWETPGGGCDAEDISMLHACARELKEEAGLEAISIGPLIPCPAAGGMVAVDQNPDEGDSYLAKWTERMGSHFFYTRVGKLVSKYYFMVETRRIDEVVLDPKEHQDYLWATEEEVRNKKMKGESGREGMKLEITTEQQQLVLLEVFKQWNENIEN